MPLRGFCCVCCGLLLVGVDLDIARGALVLYEQQSTRQSDEPVRFDVAEVVRATAKNVKMASSALRNFIVSDPPWWMSGGAGDVPRDGFL